MQRKMTFFKPMILALLAVIFFSSDSLGQATGVWLGAKDTIVKANFADYTKAPNQDRITDSIWITRQNDQGLYNIKVETGYTNSSSPSGTRWSFGTSANRSSLSFRSWEDALSSNPPSSVNKDMVMLIVKDSIYIDIKFTKWTSGGNGGGFTYIRSTDCRNRDTITTSSCDSFVSPSKKYVWKSSGVYYDTLSNAASCDSVIRINLTVHNQDTGVVFGSACGTYIMPVSKREITTTGTHYDTIVKGTVCGRDSIIEARVFIYKVPTKSYTVTSCDSFVSPSGKKVWYTSGTYDDVLPSSKTCDTAVTVNLTINEARSTPIAETACDSFVSATNRIYRVSGTYYDTLQTVVGCDSIIELDLTVFNASFNPISRTTCNVSYPSPSGKYIWTVSGTYLDTLQASTGCDSIMEVKLTVDPFMTNVTETSCEPWVSPSGKYTYTVTGVYQDTLPAGGGCDSILNIDFTKVESSSENIVVGAAINRYHSPSGKYVWTTNGTYLDTIPNMQGCDSFMSFDMTVETFDLSVTDNGTDIFVNATGVTYQWLDCNDNHSRIPGATGQSYVPPVKGSFAVEISNQWNKDTSDCIAWTLGLGNPLPADVHVYPNPSNGQFFIELGSIAGKVKGIEIRDVKGELIHNLSDINSNVNVSLGEGVARGIYVVRILGDDFVYNTSVIVQ